MARPAGFEPATPGLGNQCSILLSYGRIERAGYQGAPLGVQGRRRTAYSPRITSISPYAPCHGPSTMLRFESELVPGQKAPYDRRMFSIFFPLASSSISLSR